MNEEQKQRYVNGKECFHAGKYEEARIELTRFAEEIPGFADVHHMLGLIAHGEGRFGDAIREFSRALAVNPRYTEAALNLAVTYNDTGQYDLARKAFANVADKGDKDKTPLERDGFARGKLANMHAEIADIYMTVAEPQKAIAEYRMALDLQPAFVDIRTKLGIALRDAGEYDEATEHFKTAIDARNKYPLPRLHLGLTYHAQGEDDKAIAMWESVLAIDPDHGSATAYIAMAKGDKK